MFSIIIPNYNNGAFIGEAIQSVIRQSYSDWEVIVVDDCSTDQSIEVVRALCRDKRIRLLINSKNKGVGYSKRRGLKHARGDLIGTLGSDDRLSEDALEKMVEAHYLNLNASLIYSQMHVCDSALRPQHIFKGTGPIPEGETFLSQQNNTYHQVTSFRTFKKELYNKTEGFNHRFKKAADKDIIYKLEEVGEMVYIEEPLYYYRHHDHNISLNENALSARLWEAKAKKNAWKRRKNTEIRNLSKRQVLWEFVWTYQQLLNKNIKMMFFYHYFRIRLGVHSRLQKILSKAQ